MPTVISDCARGESSAFEITTSSSISIAIRDYRTGGTPESLRT